MKKHSLKSRIRVFIKKKFNKTDVEFFGFKLFMSTMQFLPFRLVMFNIRRLSSFLFYILKSARQDALDGLRLAFPEKTDKELNSIAKASFKNMITTFVEFAYTSKYSDEKIASKIKVEGLENLENALSKGKGAVVITGHIGNWENIASIVAIKKMRPAFIVRSLDNHKIGKYVEHWRTKRGGQEISRSVHSGSKDLRSIFEALKDNKPIGFLSDQNFSDGVFVYFFGKLACTAAGSVSIAMKTGSPILFAFDKRHKDYTHTVTFSEEMPLDIKESKDKTILYNTQKYTKILEDYIAKNPKDWLWMHRRWNTFPGERPNALNYEKYDEY